MPTPLPHTVLPTRVKLTANPTGFHSVLHHHFPDLNPPNPTAQNPSPFILNPLPPSLRKTSILSPMEAKLVQLLVAILFSFTSFSHSSNLDLLRTTSPSMGDLLSMDSNRLLRLTSRSTKKAIKSKKSILPIASGRLLVQSSIYIVRSSIGTPPQPFLVALDTGSDASWLPCSQCAGCPSSSSFDPSSSSSFLPLPCSSPLCSQFPNPSCPTGSTSCSFNLSYAGAFLQASTSQDTLFLGSDVVQNFTFGCLSSVSGTATSVPAQGLLGLARGSNSLLSQSQSLYSSTFSYCLPTFRSYNFSGSLRLGLVGQPKRIKTTPLLSNPRRKSLYYVNMTGIRIGRKPVAIPPSALGFDPATGAGTVIDTGTMFTRLVAPVYAAVRDEFRKRVNGTVTTLGGFDTCYNGPVNVPVVTLEFQGMSVNLPEENVMIHSSSGNLACLAMAAAPDNVNSVVNVIASMQQQNFRVMFDVPNGKVGMARERCTAA